jgi:hypothetical protein
MRLEHLQQVLPERQPRIVACREPCTEEAFILFTSASKVQAPEKRDTSNFGSPAGARVEWSVAPYPLVTVEAGAVYACVMLEKV